MLCYLIILMMYLNGQFGQALFESSPCISEHMSVQLRTSLAAKDYPFQIIHSNNRLQWCRQTGVINVFTRGVQKMSFAVDLARGEDQGYWFGKGRCSSGGLVQVELVMSGARIDWIRVFYPEYRFLHIFAYNTELLRQADIAMQSAGNWAAWENKE